MGNKATNDYHVEKLVSDPEYDIKDDGTIWLKEREVIQTLTWKGYLKINYNGTTLLVSRIVYRKFYGTLDPNKVVHHKDGNITNNRPDNLQQVTDADNRRRLGLIS